MSHRASRWPATLLCWMLACGSLACGPPAQTLPPLPPSPTAAPTASSSTAADTPPPLPPQPLLPTPSLPQLPKPQSGKLTSGVRYHLVERPGALASLVLQLDAGTLHGRTGAAQLTAAAVARGAASPNGSSSPQDAELALTQLGGELQVTVSAEHTRFALQVPQAQLGQAVDLLAGLAARPSLAGQLFPGTRERQAALAHTHASAGNGELMQGALLRLLLGGGDAGVMTRARGTAKELTALPFSACDAFYQKHYRAHRATLVVVSADLSGVEQRVRAGLAKLQPASGEKAAQLSAAERAPQRVYVVDVPSAESTRLWLASPLSETARDWPSAALAREQLFEIAALQLAALPNATVERAELLRWQGAGAIALLARTPHPHAARAAQRLQQAAHSRRAQPDAGMLSAMRFRVATALSRQLSSSAGTAHWLLQRQLGAAPRDQAQLTTLLKAAPAPEPHQAPPILLLVGPATDIAPQLTGLGEVLVLDPHDGFAITQAHMPNFEVVHDEPPERAPAK